MKACAHAFAAVAMTAAACAFAGDYNYNFIGHPATGINAHGIAIINCDCGAGGGGRASYYRNGAMTPVSPPGMGPNSDIKAVAINNRDQILVRSHNVATGEAGYFLYDIDRQQYRLVSNRGRLVSNPNIQDFRLGTLIALNDDDEVLAIFGGWVHANTVNGIQQVGGLAYGKPALGEPGSMALPAGLGEFTPLARPPCIDNLSYSAMNNRHQVTGTCVLAHDRGKRVTSSFIENGADFVEITAPDATWTQVTAINNAGVVAGYFQPFHSLDHRPFVYDGSHYTFLLQGTPPCPHIPSSEAYGLSDTGLISGSYVSDDLVGFIATPIAGEPACRTNAARYSAALRPAAARPQPPAPPPPSGISTRSYLGLNPRVKDGTLTFTVRGRGEAEQTVSFSGVLPVGSGSPPMWIARDAHGYVMFTILSPSMVSGVGVPEQMGAQTYEKARRGP